MASSNVDMYPRWAMALRTQPKTAEGQVLDSLPCPFCAHQGRIFPNLDQLFSHTKAEHALILQAIDPACARALVGEKALRLKFLTDTLSEATAGSGFTTNLSALSLCAARNDRTLPCSGKKRPAHTDVHGPSSSNTFRRDKPRTAIPERARQKRADARPFDPKQSAQFHTNPDQSTHQPSIECSVDTKSFDVKPQCPSIPKPKFVAADHFDARYPSLLLQPESRPISQEQLASEVKSIYAGLTMAEAKCIHVDRAYATTASEIDTNPNPQLVSDHWQALIALHKTLLHEHHDFFLASQHPSASPALRRLASKYSMPARMWKHGVRSFLELLRRKLPESVDYMLAFIYLAYQMMALLHETVPAFEDTWIECLGDLGRYRMAIEDEDIRDRETWAGVARSWYSKAADKHPRTGRLYHHLAILAHPFPLQQLYYYARSLTRVKPYPSARESILTLLDPILGRQRPPYLHSLLNHGDFLQVHGTLDNLGSTQRQEAGEGHETKRAAWLDLAFLRARLVNWNAQLTKMVIHCQNLLSHNTIAKLESNTLDVQGKNVSCSAVAGLYASSPELGISLLSTTRRFGFVSMPLALNLFMPVAAAQSANPVVDLNWKQRDTDKPLEMLAASAVLVAPAIILIISGGIAAILLWTKAEGILGIFMLILAIIFAAIRPDADSAAEQSDQYIRLAVGLGYLVVMLAYCRVVTMQPKHKKASKSKGNGRKYGKIFCTIATMLGVVFTIILMAFSGSREYWKALTDFNPIFALSLATPLSFFLCDLISNIARAVNLYGDEENEENDLLSQLSQLEAGESSSFTLQDMSMRRFRNLYRDGDAEENYSI